MAAESQPIRAALRRCLPRGIPLDPLPSLAEALADANKAPHAPRRVHGLNEEEKRLALKNALRYFPAHLHMELGREFFLELQTEGHIYMRRFRPTEYPIRAYPIDWYPAKSKQAAAIMVMIMNNLDPAVAQFPYELITYGGNGSVFSNWAQYHVIMRYLCDMTEEQTLTMFSGHPMGLFPSHRDAPRVVVTNGMVIPNYSSKRDYDRLYALGVTQYGQMTAGSYAYIGPQGIVHGTTITVLNAGRKYLGLEDLRGRVFVTSGLGGMSGAQGKAGVICGAVTVIAEVDRSALEKRHRQGWVQTVSYTLDDCIAKIRVARAEKKATSIAFLGNIVELWERLAAETDMLVDLGSDQTSLHNPFNGGYYPVQLGFEEAQKMMVADPPRFKQHVQESLRRHVKAINALCQRGMRFWDYGNSFLLEASRAGAEVMDASGSKFRYPSYVQDIMGDVFSLGFGPFRWICTSGLHEDLAFTDALAAQTIRRMQSGAAPRVLQQLSDNLLWIEHAEEHKLVVGSQARILYADARGRVEMAVAFNAAIRDGKVKGPIVLSRDHHDVSGTDSPFRETSDIYDGSSLCADMAVQNVIGDAFRGATWVSLHNGGGVGWGEVVNGGFGLVLDGSSDAERRARAMLSWDVNNGVARRAWAGNDNASFAVEEAMKAEPLLRVTIAQRADAAVLEAVIKAAEDDGRKLDRN